MAPPQLTRWIPRASSLAACMTGWATKLLLLRAISRPTSNFSGAVFVCVQCFPWWSHPRFRSELHFSGHFPEKWFAGAYAGLALRDDGDAIRENTTLCGITSLRIAPRAL